MVFRSFRLNVIIRLVLIVIAIAWLLYYALVEPNYLRSVYLFIFFIFLLGELFYYFEKTNRDLANFLTSILQKDFSTHFSEAGKGKSFNLLYKTLNRINEQFKNLSSEKEAQHLYLETLVEHVRIGIISYKEDGNIHLINEAMKQLLERAHLPNIYALGRIDEHLLETTLTINPSETRLIKVIINGKLLQLSINCSVFKIQNESYRLLSFQNIKNELETHELDTWQKLIRVLTHEIMNSVAPITSLTSTLQQIVASELEKNEEHTTFTKVGTGLEAIYNRSQGLMKFTENYRSLTKIPPPKISKVNVKDLLDNTLTLLQPTLEKKNINVRKFIEGSSPIIYADEELFQQVLINIINNAIDAICDLEKPEIAIMVAQQNDGKHTFSIHDNGNGISPENIDKIFIPFFTTKKEGSGIGLALSRQILQRHNATITVESRPEEGTTFLITI